VRLELQ